MLLCSLIIMDRANVKRVNSSVHVTKGKQIKRFKSSDVTLYKQGLLHHSEGIYEGNIIVSHNHVVSFLIG